MKNIIRLTLITVLFQFNIVKAQLNNNQFEGYVITKNGDKIEGIIEVSNSRYPWTFQETIRFFDKSLLEDGKVKNKEKTKYKPDELLEYGIGNRKFKPIEYNDNNQISNNGLNETIGMFKSVIKTKHFAELFHNGKISVYKFYSSPPDFAINAGDDQIKDYSNFVEKCKTTYDVLIEKEGEKAKSFDEINIKKFFKNCSYVVDKYENKQYTKQPVKGLKSLIKDALLRGEPLANSAMEIVIDYEANCK